LNFFLGKFLLRLQSERNLNPLPNYCYVIRLTRPSKDFNEKGKISAIQINEQVFRLSSDDEISIPPHLSVWVSSLTTSKQACLFLEDQSLPKIVLRLSVAEVRNITGHCGDEKTYPNSLNVIWVHKSKNLNGQQIRDRRPGAAGHSGIIGLYEKDAPTELTKRQAKNLRKDLRVQLAEIASKDYSIISEM
jgi:hypothetical protein